MPTYQTPTFRYGQRVECLARGEVIIVGLTAAPVPWPIGKKVRARSLVLYRDLAKAVRLESNLTVCRFFGVDPQTVSKWRKALGVPENNEGTLRRRVEVGKRNKRAIKAMATTFRDPSGARRLRPGSGRHGGNESGECPKKPRAASCHGFSFPGYF